MTEAACTNLESHRAVALATSEHRAVYLDSRGLLELHQGRFQDAWNDFDAAVRAHPQDAHYRFGRGIAALRLGREAQGRSDLAAATALDPHIAETYAGHGITP